MGGLKMRKTISFVGLTILLSVVILGFMQFTNTPSAYSMKYCCNLHGYFLCDPNSEYWDIELWSCSDNGYEFTITAEQCFASWDCGPPPVFVACEFK
jgi:hypothetical protein